MLCQYCKEREATIHMTQSVNGVISKVDMCAQCANKQNLNFMDNFGFSNLFSEFFSHKASIQDAFDMICPSCNGSFQRFRENKLVGCEDCYTTFSEQMEPIVLDVQGSTIHEGKIPSHADEKVREAHELKQMKKELDDAVAREDYEKAAELRDRMKEKEGREEQ